MLRTGRRSLSTRPGRRSLAAAAIAMAATVALSGCTLLTTLVDAADPGATPGPDESGVPTDVATDAAAYYAQELNWSPCQGNLECATAAAPIDWDDTVKGEIELALMRVPAQGTAIGSLFLNPGGPGASGIEFASYAEYVFGSEVLRNYDIVGWDPRGVGASTPIECVDDAELDEFLYPTPEPGFDSLPEAEQVAQIEEESRWFGQQCLENTGPMLEYVDTISTIHDLDMLRAAVGDEQLNYIGFSYGTYIGALYIDNFPDRVGRMVLDGAVDPSLTTFEIILAQQAGFAAATEAYLTDCLSSAQCPFSGTYDSAIAQIKQIKLDVDAALPKNPDGRVLTSGVIGTAITATMYSETSWPDLSQAFTMYLQSGDTTGFFALADSYNDRNPDGTYNSNLMEAFASISCMDQAPETDEAAIVAFNRAYLEANPLALPDIETLGDTLCEQFPFTARATPGPVTGAGAAPVLVVGTTGDPATPYDEAVALSQQLESATLVTYEGEGHTAYGQDACINGIVDSYLVDGVVPEGAPVC